MRVGWTMCALVAAANQRRLAQMNLLLYYCRHARTNLLDSAR